MDDEAIHLDEASLVEQEIQALASRKLSLCVLRRQAGGASSELRFPGSARQLRDPFSHGHRGKKVAGVPGGY